MLRYYCDTELNGFGGELISIALVPEDDDYPPFYEATFCSDPLPWVAQNVIPVLRTKPIAINHLRQGFITYLSDDFHPVIVADWPEDLAQASRLLTNENGKRLFEKSIEFVLIESSDFQTVGESELRHNAYYDAVALKRYMDMVRLNRPLVGR